MDIDDIEIDDTPELVDDGELSDEEIGIYDEQNQFDAICDGVLNCMAMVHTSMSELLVFKDDSFTQALPPVYLLQMTMTISNVYRSINILHEPLSELVRLVRVYSSPWDEKSTALKKLHDSYDKKCRQLDVAVRRLQMIHAKAEKADRDKELINWANLMTKTMKTKCVPIDALEESEEYVEGASALETYIKELQKAAKTKKASSPKPVAKVQAHKEDPQPTKPTKRKSPILQRSRTAPLPDTEEQEKPAPPPPPEKEIITKTVYIKPPPVDTRDADTQCGSLPEMVDRGIWTDTTVTLNLRIFTPKCDHSALKVLVKFGKITKKTRFLDNVIPTPSLKSVPEKNSAARKGLQRIPGQKDTLRDSDIKFDDIIFELPDDPATMLGSTSSNEIKLSIIKGSKEEVCALGTIDLHELHELDLYTATRPAPMNGSEFFGNRTAAIEAEKAHRQATGQEYFSQSSKLDFPLYSVSRKEVGDIVVAKIPIAAFWSRTPRPVHQERSTCTEHLNALIEDITGIDMTAYTKDDIMREMFYKEEIETNEIALSPYCVTPEEKEDVLPREEYEALISKHSEELADLQAQYAEKIEQISESLAMAEMKARESSAKVNRMRRQAAAAAAAAQREASSVASAATPGSKTTISRASTRSADSKWPQKKFVANANLPIWGDTLPEDFFDRLKLFNELTATHRKELLRRHTSEVREQIEKQMATQYRLSTRRTQDIYSALTDASLPSMFMPNRTGTIYNARAHQYFHPSMAADLPRLTQPPSIFQLPALTGKDQKITVVNLFDLARRTAPACIEKPDANVRSTNGFKPPASKPVTLYKHISETEYCIRGSELMDRPLRPNYKLDIRSHSLHRTDPTVPYEPPHEPGWMPNKPDRPFDDITKSFELFQLIRDEPGRIRGVTPERLPEDTVISAGGTFLKMASDEMGETPGRKAERKVVFSAQTNDHQLNRNKTENSV